MLTKGMITKGMVTKGMVKGLACVVPPKSTTSTVKSTGPGAGNVPNVWPVNRTDPIVEFCSARIPSNATVCSIATRMGGFDLCRVI